MRTRTLVAIWSVPAWYTAIDEQLFGLVNSGPPELWRQMLPALAEWYLWVPLTPIVLRLADRFPIVRQRTGQTVAVHVAAVCAISLLRGAVYTSASAVFAHRSLSPWWAIMLYNVPLAAAIYGAIVAIDSTAKLQTQLARAELVALRANLQPHFLFNALHAVGALVRARDQDGAIHVITELGDLLRAVLRRDAPEDVPLAEELAFVERYLSIEQVRFRDRLRVQWNVAPDVQRAVVPRFLVQPLAENAIRHGIGRSSTAGLVVIAAVRRGDWLEVDVTDDGPGPSGNGDNGGLGLATARARLRHAYGPSAEVTLTRGPDGGAIARARLPFRHA